MATNNNKLSDIDKLIENYNNLKENPFKSSLDDLKQLSIETKKYFSEMNDELESASKNIKKITKSKNLKDVFKDSKNIAEDIAKVEKQIQILSKGNDKKKQQAKELQKVLKEVKKASHDYYSSLIREQSESNKRMIEGVTILDDWGERFEQRTKALKKGFSEISKGTKQMFGSIKNTIEPWSKANHEAMQYAKTMGISQKNADKYLKNTISWASNNNIGILFNKTTDELIKMQSKYSDILGRNVQLTSNQKKDMLAMEKFLGEDGMMEIANNLENFGLGLSDSADFVKKTMDEATKKGVAFSKLTKTIRENIKMAQDYTFKNGLEGLSNMAKKAVELKTDMSLVNGFIEKTSTVEGALTTGAKLQVLGGSYAVGSDPLSMLYDSLNNVEGLFDRAVSMAKGKVFYNDRTGNFEMGAMDRYMMKQAATAMGIDPSKMIDVAFRQASLNRIENQINSNSDISKDKDMVELVKNLATWDKGNAVINIDGKDVKVSELNTKDHKAQLEAMQKTDSQNLQDIAINLRSTKDIISGTQKEINNEQAEMVKVFGETLNSLLRQNTGFLNSFSKIGALGNTILGINGLLDGIWLTTIGILRSVNGVGNLGRGLGRNTSKAKRGIMRTGSAGRQIVGIGRKYGAKNAVKALSKTGGKLIAGSLGAGLTAGAFSLGQDIINGDFKKDMGSSIGDAAGKTIGGTIGMFLGGPIGAMVGGAIGGVISDGIQEGLKNKRNTLRKNIADNLSLTMPNVSELFIGENSLSGNYTEKQLKTLERALSDGVLNESELNKRILRKARANDDLSKIKNAGISMNVAMASGGLLVGNSHSNGGMPILGSNIVVEGGEFVVNKKATKDNLPLLEKINNNYKITPKQPLGQQMMVNSNYLNSSSLNSKVNIEPISINLSGTIKLDSGNRQFDISNELLNNPQLITKLTEMISKQINILDYGSYNKGNFKQKFT